MQVSHPLIIIIIFSIVIEGSNSPNYSYVCQCILHCIGILLLNRIPCTKNQFRINFPKTITLEFYKNRMTLLSSCDMLSLRPIYFLVSIRQSTERIYIFINKFVAIPMFCIVPSSILHLLYHVGNSLPLSFKVTSIFTISEVREWGY